MGTPSRVGGGLTLASFESLPLCLCSSSSSSLSLAAPESVPGSDSSALVPWCRILPSLAGLRPWKPTEPGWPLILPGTWWPCVLVPVPLPVAGLLAPGEVAVRWGMFSGTGWLEPMLVTPTSDALPALLRA